MVGPVVVHWLVPPITVKFPDASIFNFVLSYFNDTIFNVLLIVVTLFNVAFTDIYNVDTNVPGLLKEIIVGGLDIAL